MVKQIIQNTLTEMEQELTNNGCNKDKIKKGIDELYLLYMKSVNSTLKKFEEEFRNILTIPDNVLLEEDKFKSIPVSTEEFENLNKDLRDLEQQLIQVIFTNQSIHKTILINIILGKGIFSSMSTSKECF